MCGRKARVLLIGNSRWHWAERCEPVPLPGAPLPGAPPPGAPPPGAPSQARSDRAPAPWLYADGPPPQPEAWSTEEILAWAAVGPVPESHGTVLPPGRRVQTTDVPLAGRPPWLGVDRALVAWEAWQRQQADGPAPVLVADAGTVLSLTLVSEHGRFLGGRLLAGAGLQWRAMASGTVLLPALPSGMGAGADPLDSWPQTTAAAMEIGVLQGLAAAVALAAGELRQGHSHGPPGHSQDWQGMAALRVWLCGGDGPRLAPLLRGAGVAVIEAPHLAMEALIRCAGLS